MPPRPLPLTLTMTTLHRPNAPPSRNGVGASCVVLPSGPWPRVIDFLVQRFPGVSAETARKIYDFFHERPE